MNKKNRTSFKNAIYKVTGHLEKISLKNVKIYLKCGVSLWLYTSGANLAIDDHSLFSFLYDSS